MKILMAIDSLMGGGAEKLINDMTPRLKKRGYNIDVLILTNDNAKYKENLEQNDISVLTMDNVKGHLRKCIFLYHVFKERRYDVVHANLFPVIYYVSVVSRLPGIKIPALVMTEHNTDNRRRYRTYMRPIERFIYKQYKKIISISFMTQERLKSWLRFSKEMDDKFTVIDNGVPVDEFASAVPYDKTELFSNYVAGDVLLGMIGTFSKQKNHKGMLNIMEHLPSQYKLICVGEGSMMSEVQRQSMEKGLEDRVEFLGFRADVAQIMHTVDIVVIPSVWEGFGLVAIEAMACGKPVVASDVPGLAEVVGEFGLLGDQNDPKDFSDKIRMLEDNNIYNFYEKQSKKHAAQYDINRMVQSYEDVYNESID